MDKTNESNETNQLDANDVIDELTRRNAMLIKENAILSVQLQTYKEINDKQQKLIEAYEKKEKLNAAK